MIDERFLHPAHMLDCSTGELRVVVYFRKRNHLLPCTTRRMKTMRSQLTRAMRRYEKETKRRMAAGEHFSILPSSMSCSCGHCVETILERQSPGLSGGLRGQIAAEIRRRVAAGERLDEAGEVIQ